MPEFKKPQSLTLPKFGDDGQEQAPRKPRALAIELPDLTTIDENLKLAQTAVEFGGVDLKDPSVRKFLHHISNDKELMKRWQAARDRGVCPMCFDSSCDWPESDEARAMGWGGLRVQRPDARER